jgi:cyclopropane fatty-acyl-phospholipid synthase-like methyltransferase
MDDLKQSIIKSLDGTDDALYEHLPYLLQDLWEIGSSPDVIMDLIKNNGINRGQDLKVLDLGCGKGAVSVRLAKVFGFHIHGIDGMPLFVIEAEKWARKYKVSELCRFEIADIRIRLDTLKDYDLIILGSIGQVLGNIEATLRKVKDSLSSEGCVILDEGYRLDEGPENLYNYPDHLQVYEQIKKAGFEVMEEHLGKQEFIQHLNQQIMGFIQKRVEELKTQFPDRKHLFEKYLEAQKIESDILENYMQCVTWLLKRSV